MNQSPLYKLIVFGVVALLLLGGYMLFGAVQGKLVERAIEKVRQTRLDETPRLANPMGEYTPMFQQRVYELEDDLGLRRMVFYLLAPENAGIDDNGALYPLVLVLHGAPGEAQAARILSYEPMRAAYPVFILAPALSKEQRWANARVLNPHYDRLPDTVRLIQNLIQAYPIDPSRLYVVGCGEGGIGALGAARYYSDFFAAAVSFSGGWQATDAPHLIDLPLLLLHGTQDEVIPVQRSREIANRIEALGGNINYIETPEMGHNCPMETLYGSWLWDWVFSQQRQ